MGTPSEQFAERYKTRLLKRLGFGRDGSVWYTDRGSAVKFLTDHGCYLRERDAYLTLARLGIDSVLGHTIPNLLQYDDELKSLEMSIVRPPFLLDFASAYPEDEAPDFPPEVWDQWMEDKAEEFGDRWFDVLRVRAAFQKVTGLVLMDVNPGNIKFG